MPDRSGEARPVVVHGAGGRMGRAVTALLRESRDLSLCGCLELRERRLSGAEESETRRTLAEIGGAHPVVIDFSHPDALGPLLEAIRGSRARLVCGTTGFNEEQRGMLKTFSEEHAVFYDENMSYGIIVMKAMLRAAAGLLGESFQAEIIECHHRAKLDRPSGTALALAGVLEEAARDAGSLSVSIHSLRQGGVPGDHEVRFASAEEVLTVAHRAISRSVFARGALRAARFIHGKSKGMFSMEDLINRQSPIIDADPSPGRSDGDEGASR